MSSNIIGEAAVRIRPETAGFARDTEAQIGGRLRRSGARLGAQLGLAVGAGRLIASTYSAITGAEQGLANVSSVAEANERQLASLARQAQETGRALGFGAREGLEAQFELAKAGVSVRETLGGAFEGTLALAAAGELELGEAATFAANAMKTFGLRGRDVTGIADAFATAANATTADVADFGIALSQGGSVARQAGLSFTQTIAVLEALAEIGVKNSDAGTSLRSTILQLLNPTKEQADLQQELGLSLIDSNGALKDGAQVAGELQRATQGLNRAQRTQLFAQLAGTDGVRTLNALYEAGPRRLRDYQRGLERQGSAAETARKRQQSLRGDTEKLAASFETLQIRAASATTAVARQATQQLTGLVDQIADSPELERGAAALGEGLLSAFNDPQNQAAARQFGTTAVDVLGAVRTSALATAPAVQAVAQAFGAAAGSPLGPQLLLTAVGYRVLSRGASAAEGPVQRLRTAQQANAAAALAQRAAVAQSVSAIGLVGPSSARAAQGVARSAGGVRTLATGLTALAGGPIPIAVAGVATLAAGAFLLSQREGLAEAEARRFNDALRDQAVAAQTAAAGLTAARDATTALAQGRVAVDQAREGVGRARTDVQRVEAAPTAEFGGEAARRDAVAAATHRLAVAEDTLRQARTQNRRNAEGAVGSINIEARAIQNQIEKSRGAVEASGALGRQGAVVARVTNLNRAAVEAYATALGHAATGQARAAANAQRLATEAQRQARTVDTSSTAGKRYAGVLRDQAAQLAVTAQRTRVSAIVEANRSVAASRAIVASRQTTAAEKDAARERIATQQALAERLARVGLGAGRRLAEETARGARSRRGEMERAGRDGGRAAADGAAATSGEATAAGQGVGVALGQGVAAGITSQTPAVANVARGLVQEAEAAARDEAETGSPSRVFARLGVDLGRGAAVGMASEQARTNAAAGRLVMGSVTAAGQAGVRNARTQGARIIGALADGFEVGGGGFRAAITTTISSALRESVLTARSNLRGFASELADLGRQAIEAAPPGFAPQRGALAGRGAALDAASAQDEERRLRNAIALAEAGRENAQRRLQQAEAAAARRTPEQAARISPLQRERERQRLEELRGAAQDPARAARLELDRFLLGQDEARLAAEEQAAQERVGVQQAALDRGLADLTANLAAGRIKLSEFNAGVTATLAANGVNVAAVGAQLGTAFVDSFGTALDSLGAQGRAVAGAPRLPAGFLAGIERPAQVALQEAVAARTLLRQALVSEGTRTRESQRANIDRLRQSFQEESSVGGRRIVASEQRQLTARALEHKETLKELRRQTQAFLSQPPQVVIESIVTGAPGVDAQAIGAAVARALSRESAQRARR